MGYETKLYLARNPFASWIPKEDFHSPNNPDLEYLPDDAKICTDFVSIAEVDLCKCGYTGPAYKFFQEGREDQKRRKMYASVDYEGFTHLDGPYEGELDNYHVLVDNYGDPLGLHDPTETLAVLREEIQLSTEAGEPPYRRFVLAEAMISACLESRLPALARIGAQANGAKIDSSNWLFPGMVILSFGH